ncbi:hypothetical protein PFICI_08181 [Pestalotiopsis fici W106-1]|uniref:Rhodopsin domain-containing protein n=1 Tax=Pestalotiopsis fici (strain W106-1 / CGMCC3.15140) TaxID=1229662 RepID=W3X5G5_PESFW|nr:uncharacterized protein PFICI_08181 [Pestalotiopsis fici W106-1]ETS80652.1 hypothetical protein PFICI_08181 [Pestalotiopsis fici W106-1]
MAEIPNRSPLVEGVTWAMFTIALPPVLLRTWARATLMKKFGIDDWLMIFAMISFTFNTVICFEGAVHGTGRHYWNLELDSMTTAFEWWYFAYLTYCTSMILVKSSIACFLLRLTPDRTHRIIIYIAWWLTVVCGIIFFFIAMFQCRPISFFWTRVADPASGGSCISIDTIVYVTYTYSAFSIITDFTFTILPIWMVWQLQMSLRTKIAIIPILGMAAVASCAVVVRLAYVENFRGNDFLWSTADIAIWSQVEIGLAIAAGSLATLRPLFHSIGQTLGLPGLSGSSPGAAVAVPASAKFAPSSSSHGQKNHKSAVSCGKKNMSPLSRIMAPYSLFSLQSNAGTTRLADEEQTVDIHMEEVIPARNHNCSNGSPQQPGNEGYTTHSLKASSQEGLVGDHAVIAGLEDDDKISMHDSCHSKLPCVEFHLEI